MIRNCIFAAMALCITTSAVLAEDKKDVQELYRQCKNTGHAEEIFCGATLQV